MASTTASWPASVPAGKLATQRQRFRGKCRLTRRSACGAVAAGPRVNGDGSRTFSPRIGQLKAAHVPARLRSLLMTMLAAEPAARPGTRQLAERLERIQAQVSGSGKSLRRAAFVSVVAALIGGGIWILHALETPPTRAPSNAPPKSIAVLPFENLSAEKENAYLPMASRTKSCRGFPRSQT